ncbi:hypothetical protein Micbo1qcDRAFT_235241 [Microdochium bolleyi]|uniref:Uncharacterized protein n=1 Tax=Microdochium bolleyi TaxID=196109 RepID=A0A136IWX9_9PEZI|nr:hypothetical protein Micbo1qcDRAFT_235241 [Microdochium bolleyi]
MFGTLTSLVQSATVGPPPKDAPPPTEVVLPDYRPEFGGDGNATGERAVPAASLVAVLQKLHRPPQLDDSYFRALGVHVHHNVSSEDLVPDPALLPQESGWDGMTPERAQDANKTFQKLLCNGNKSPDARIYADRRKELSADNQAAFRTLRRIKPQPGKQAVRLGGSYEFFKQMDLMAGYWDDTSLPKPAEQESRMKDEADAGPPPATHIPHPIDGSLDQAAHALVAATAEPARKSCDTSSGDCGQENSTPEQVVYRTAPGSQMPGSFRHDMVGAFIRLVVYDFGCNITPSRVEPRLYLRTPVAPQQSTSSASGTRSTPDNATDGKETTSSRRTSNQHKEPVASHFSSGCSFITRTPTTREAARAGIVEGPVAALSVRKDTSFADPLDHRLDLGRELVAALITAQLRARGGKAEQRLGEGKWWATEKRWGGGQGGPIGREVENDDTTTQKQRGDGGARGGEGDSRPLPGSASRSPVTSPTPSSAPSPSPSLPPPATKSQLALHPSRGRPPTTAHPGSSQGSNKRARKTLSIYDNYRMVRKPTSNWDRKSRYEAIGKVAHADHDDIFLLSSVFHHLSVLRVRVPLRLLAVIEGDVAGAVGADTADDDAGGSRSGIPEWGGLEVWRSKWFDLFLVPDRLEAMRLIWGVMMWLMREQEDKGNTGNAGSGEAVGQNTQAAQGKSSAGAGDVAMMGT